MKKFIVVVRHGAYDGEGEDRASLSLGGRGQMEALAERLKPIIEGCSIDIFSTPAERARESAEILANAFNAPYQVSKLLLAEFKFEIEQVCSRILATSPADVTILVGHESFTKALPAYFAKDWAVSSFKAHSLFTGQAWVLDCKQKTITYVVP